MAQHDFNLANQSGAAFRADLNDALSAIVSQNSGATEPATMFAYQLWADTTAGWLKQRNASNSAWIKRLPLGTAARTDIASASTLDLDSATCNSDYMRVTGTTTTTAITLADGQRRLLIAAGAWPITHGSSLLCPGSSSYTCAAGDIVLAIGEPSSVVRLVIWKADGTPVVGSSSGSRTITAGENLADRDLIYQDIYNQRAGGADRWYKVDSDATGPVKISPIIGIALAAITSGNSGSAQTGPGSVTGLSGLTNGQPVYASGTAGIMTQTTPALPSSGTQNATRMVGVATSTTTMDFNPERRTIFTARNSALASASSVSVEHFTDSGASEREPFAYIAGVNNAAIISGGTGTNIGDMTAGGGLAEAFNGTTSVSQGSCCKKAPSTSGYNNSVGKDWGVGNTKTITRFTMYGPTDASFVGGTTANYKLQGSTDNFSGSIVDLYSGTTGSGNGQVIDVTSGITTSTAYRYHRVIFNGNGTDTAAIAELQLYEGTGTRSEPVMVSSESISSAATDRVTCRFDDGAGASPDTKTTFINRTNATRDMVVEVEV